MLQGWAATSSPVRVHGRSNNCTLAALSLPPAMQEIQVPSLGGEDPLEEGMVTHFSILAWAISWRRGAWWTTVHGVARVRHNWSGLAHTHTHRRVHADTYSHSRLSSGESAPPCLWLSWESNQSLLLGFLSIMDMGSVFRNIFTKNEGEPTKMRLLAPLTTTTTQNNNLAEIEECRTPVHYS